MEFYQDVAAAIATAAGRSEAHRVAACWLVSAQHQLAQHADDIFDPAPSERLALMLMELRDVRIARRILRSNWREARKATTVKAWNTRYDFFRECKIALGVPGAQA